MNLTSKSCPVSPAGLYKPGIKNLNPSGITKFAGPRSSSPRHNEQSGQVSSSFNWKVGVPAILFMTGLGALLLSRWAKFRRNNKPQPGLDAKAEDANAIAGPQQKAESEEPPVATVDLPPAQKLSVLKIPGKSSVSSFENLEQAEVISLDASSRPSSRSSVSSEGEASAACNPGSWFWVKAGR